MRRRYSSGAPAVRWRHDRAREDPAGADRARRRVAAGRGRGPGRGPLDPAAGPGPAGGPTALQRAPGGPPRHRPQRAVPAPQAPGAGDGAGQPALLAPPAPVRLRADRSRPRAGRRPAPARPVGRRPLRRPRRRGPAPPRLRHPPGGPLVLPDLRPPRRRRRRRRPAVRVAGDRPGARRARSARGGLALTAGGPRPRLAAMKLGLAVPHYGGPTERQGTPECWTMLSALAMRTSRVRLGTLVMAVGFRPPALLAKMAATLDQLAEGRLDLGLGAGWNEPEFTENGLPFPRPGERLAMLEESLGVLRALLTDSPTPASFQGRFYRVEQAPVIPGPVQRPRPPLWVGGKGDRLLGVVARAADGWNVVWSMTPEDYRERLGVLEAACRRAGRPPGEVRRSLGLSTLIGRDADDLVERWRRLQAWTPGGGL